MKQLADAEATKLASRRPDDSLRRSCDRVHKERNSRYCVSKVNSFSLSSILSPRTVSTSQAAVTRGSDQSLPESLANHATDIQAAARARGGAR
eukprot:8057424-Pyramimonas_sp.AAC.1